MRNQTIVSSRTGDLDEATRATIVHVCIAAHANTEFQQLFALLPADGLHVLGYAQAQLVSHAVATTRWLQPEGLALLKTAYVDAVSTAPAFQGQGFGSAVMRHLGWTLDSTMKCTISLKLKSSYDFAPTGSTTPQLLERLAFSESSYNQFISMSLMQPKTQSKCNLGVVSGMWPNESPANPQENIKAGKFIGLMQVPNSEDTAWNWVDNIAMGATGFKDFIRVAKVHETRIRNEHGFPTAVPTLSATQIEQLAVGRFKGFLDPVWYWAPRCSVDPPPQCPYMPPNMPPTKCAGGTWSWIPNPCPCTHNRSATDSTDPKCPTGENNVIVQVDKVIGSSAIHAACEQ